MQDEVMLGTGWRRRSLVLGFLVAAGGVATWELGATPWADTARRLSPVTSQGVAPPPPPDGAVTALGRLRPKDGVTRVAGPAHPAAVIARLLVDKGDRVQE